MEIGLKIWSINHESFNKLSDFYDKGIIDYVELYTYPESFESKALSRLLNIPMILHAPTFLHGMNLGDSKEKIAPVIIDIEKYTAFFKTDGIIFHPGVMVESIDKSMDNIILNLTDLCNIFDIILENVPAIGIDNESIMLAASPSEFANIISSTKVKTCLDFGHAITSANYVKEEPFYYIEQFLKNNPFMYHLSDGEFISCMDQHLHFHEGSFPLKKIVDMIPKNARLSLETPKKDFKELSEDVLNIRKLKEILNN